MIKSPNQLQQEAKLYKFNKSIPLKIYLKTCISLIDKAQILSNENQDLENAYVFYMRYLDLCMNKLSLHPEILTAQKQLQRTTGSLEVKEYYQILQLEVPAILKIAEEMQKKLESLYQKELVKQYIKPTVKHQFQNSHESRLNKVQVKEDNDYTLEFKLPSSFNENLFNQSLQHMKKNIIKSRSNANDMPNNNTDGSAEGKQSETDSKDEMKINYPDLPNLCI